MSYHKEWVTVTDEFGNSESVYRSLRRCKHCVGWNGGNDHFATCSKLNKKTSRDITTCGDFIATEEGLNQMWIESEARIGDEICKITYKGKPYFIERKKLISSIGWDPDIE